MNVDEKIRQISQVIVDLNDELLKHQRIKAHQVYGKMTIDQIREQWNSYDPTGRWIMIETVPELLKEIEGDFDDMVRPVDVANIRKYEFDEENEWDIDLPAFFKEYCRPEKHAKKEVNA